MSEWEDLNILNKVEAILEQASRESQVHHFGGPFLTAYQIAISYAELYPEDLERMEYDIGGKDTGVHYSLTQYLANQLSNRIDSREITNIEGRFISNRYVSNLIFDSGDIHVESSAMSNRATISMFRLINQDR